MIVNERIQRLKVEGSGNENFDPEVLQWISAHNLWNLWVPEQYNGLGCSLLNGLSKLQSLARIDGSLGWTVTLCSGANFFIGNLPKPVSQEIFLGGESPAILGGSGGVFGTAEKTEEGFKINGKWKYATGAPYLSHFTMNASVIENGKPLLDEKGSRLILSFLLPKEEVKIVEDWDAVGLEASATHSFEVRDVHIHGDYSFQYNSRFLPQSIFKIDFSVFADLTLWVNYIGMAEHFQEESRAGDSAPKAADLEFVLENSNEQVIRYAADVEYRILSQKCLPKEYVKEIHQEASRSVKNISQAIIGLYPYLGIKASRSSHILNKIFRDYFTATQHHIFTRNSD